jgi:uncharacterized protein with HEPN domain
MLEAGQEALSFAVGKTRSDLNLDRKLVLSLVKDVEIIGEAAGKVSDEARIELGEIPWQDIVSMRNRLIHVYFDFDLDVVWDTIVKDLPPLVRILEKAIPSDNT